MKDELKKANVYDKHRPYTTAEKIWTVVYLVVVAVGFCFFGYLLISSLISLFAGNGLAAVALIVYNCYINSAVVVVLAVAFFVIRGVYKRAKLPLIALLAYVALYSAIWIIILAMG